jgi:hypothetical protein
MLLYAPLSLPPLPSPGLPALPLQFDDEHSLNDSLDHLFDTFDCDGNGSSTNPAQSVIVCFTLEKIQDLRYHGRVGIMCSHFLELLPDTLSLIVTVSIPLDLLVLMPAGMLSFNEFASGVHARAQVPV